MSAPRIPDAPDGGRGVVDTPPPFLGRWSNVYLLVLGELAVLVVVFYLITRWAS